MARTTLARRIGRIGAIAIVLAMLGVAGWYYAHNWSPSTKTYTLQGLDVSEAQGTVDWWTLRAGGADFAYVRATNGTARDANFADNWAQVHATGMRRGAIHLYSLCVAAADQANNFNTTVPRSTDALPAAVELDFQVDCASKPEAGVVLDELRRFLTIVELNTGKPMLLKITRRFDKAYGVSAAIPRPVWAVQNFLSPDYAARPWRMWTASDMRRVDGVGAPVNWDVVAP